MDIDKEEDDKEEEAELRSSKVHGGLLQHMRQLPSKPDAILVNGQAADHQ